jgi:hypothetical protein
MFDTAFWIVVLVVALAAIFTVVQSARANTARRNTRQAVFDAYQSELATLRQKPTDPNIKQRAMQLGRKYANQTKQQKGEET